MKAKPGKCRLLLNTKSPEFASIDRMQITSSTAETVLGITINPELNFVSHLSVTICNDEKLMLLGRLPILCHKKNVVL